MKGPWEARMGLLLRPRDFVWSFKTPDSPLYGGQPRIDWVACDFRGKFWMVEVKQAAKDRKSINIATDVSAGQITALNAVVGGNGVALLAIGQDNTLYIHSWRAAWLHYQRNLEYRVKLPAVLKLDGPSLLHQFRWTGPKAWKQETLYEKVMTLGQLRFLPFELPDQYHTPPIRLKL